MSHDPLYENCLLNHRDYSAALFPDTKCTCPPSNEEKAADDMAVYGTAVIMPDGKHIPIQEFLKGQPAATRHSPDCPLYFTSVTPDFYKECTCPPALPISQEFANKVSHEADDSPNVIGGTLSELPAADEVEQEHEYDCVSCCRLQDELDEARAELAAKDAEIERLRNERDKHKTNAAFYKCCALAGEVPTAGEEPHPNLTKLNWEQPK